MKVETWLPIVTLLLGWAGAQVTEILRDRRANNRERLARQAELQQSTRLALQDTLLQVTDLASAAHLAAFRTTLAHPDEGATREAEKQEREAKFRVLEAADKAKLLISRIDDERARMEAALLLHAAYMVGPADADAANEALNQLHDRYAQVVDRLGELIRERY